jgi:hypothetical protein
MDSFCALAMEINWKTASKNMPFFSSFWVVQGGETVEALKAIENSP